MITKCANPACGALFRYLREGKLFLVEPPPSSIDRAQFLPPAEAEFKTRVPRSEYFWLCERCARSMTIAPDQNGLPVLVVLRNRHQAAPVIPGK